MHVRNNLPWRIALLTRCVVVTSACNNPFNVRFAKRALRALHKTIPCVCCFVKPFGVHYTANRTRHGTSHVSHANTLVLTRVCGISYLIALFAMDTHRYYHTFDALMCFARHRNPHNDTLAAINIHILISNSIHIKVLRLKALDFFNKAML